MSVTNFYNEMNNARKARPHRAGTGARDMRTQRYVDPWDCLLYAILLQAVNDSKGDKWGVECKSPAIKFLKSDRARAWWDYLKTRPKYD